jgi:hypothetical protein
MEEETLGSIVSKFEKVVWPIGFRIQLVKRNYISPDDPPFSCAENSSNTDDSYSKLKITITRVVDSLGEKTLTSIISRLEDGIVPLGFTIKDIEKEYPYSGTQPVNNKVRLIINIFLLGKLG